jgi:hypothetical protein
MTVVKDEAGRATALVVFATDITQRRRLEEMLRDNTQRVVQFAERIARLQKLLAEARDVEESLTKQTSELDADSQELRKRIAQWAQSQEMPGQYADPPPGWPGPLSQQTRPTDGRRQSRSAAPCVPPGREKAEHEQAADVLGTGSDASPGAAPTGRTPRSQARRYPLDTEELRKIADLGRRLAGLPQ